MDRTIESIEAERVHWWRLACGRLGILYDVIKTQPRVDTPDEYHAWLEDFILAAIDKMDKAVGNS